MKKIGLFIISLLVVQNLVAQVNSGILFGVGNSWLNDNYTFKPARVDLEDGNYFYIGHPSQRKSNLSLTVGYQFQFENIGSEKIFVDLAFLYHARFINITKPTFGKDLVLPPSGIASIAATSDIHIAAVQGAINYKVYRNWSLGLGIEPSIYFTNLTDNKKKKQTFDIPLVARLGYTFNNKMQLMASYKHGWNSFYKSEGIKDLRMREVQISLYVPLFKK